MTASPASPPSSGPKAPRSRLRVGLLFAVVGALAFLAVVVALEPRRLLGSRPQPGRTAAATEAAWTLGAAAPVALTEVAAAAHDGRIWVVGGMDAHGRAVDLVQVYDPGTDSWAAGPTAPRPVHHAALVADGDDLLLLGGYDGTTGLPADAVWRLGGDGVWVAIDPLPAPRAAGAAAWDGRGHVLYGGGVGPDGVSGTVVVLDAAGWRELTSLSAPREHLAATSLGAGSVTFMGGRVGGLAGNVGTVDLVSAEGVAGRTEDLSVPRGGIAAFSTPALGDCALGGEGPDGTFGAVECLGPIRRTTLPGLAVPRHGLGAATLDGRAYALLGGREPGLTVSDVVEVLDLRRSAPAG